MLKWLMLSEKKDQEMTLPRECDRFAYVLYRECDDGMVFAGLYDPDVPDKDYCDGIVAVPLKSTFVGIKDFKAGDSIYNVQGSKDDKIFVDKDGKPESATWIQVWRDITKRECDYTPAEKCYVRFEGADTCKSKDLVGGHMMEGESGVPNKGDTVYILPICKGHNFFLNKDEMKISFDVKAIEMKYKVNSIAGSDKNMFVSSVASSQITSEENTFNGIDVSVYNGSVDFKRVKQSGIDFVMIREGYGSDGICPKQIDSNFAKNYSNAKKAGLYVGAYHYLYATTVNGAIQEAEGFLASLKGKQFEMPVALDIEEVVHTKLPVHTVDEIIKAFMTRCENAGYFCVLYSYESFLTSKISDEVREKYSVWCANVSATPHIKHGIHQYSFKGRIDGINGFVDLDRAYKDYPKIIKTGGFNGYPKGSK